MATPGIYTLSLHDALPISRGTLRRQAVPGAGLPRAGEARPRALLRGARGQAPGLAEGVDRAVCSRARPQAALMSQAELILLAENPHDRLVWKPAGMTSEQAADRFPGAKLPHRLDRVTRGILMLCFGPEAIAFHNAQIQARRWEKYYLA